MIDNNDETRSDARQILSLFMKVRGFTFQQASGWLGLELPRVDRAIQYLRHTGQIADDKTFPEFYVLPEPPESPHAAPKPSDPSTHTTQQSECIRGEIKRFCVDAASNAQDAVSTLAAAYRLALIEIQSSHDKIGRVDQLQADSDAYHALKAKLRDLSHE